MPKAHRLLLAGMVAALFGQPVGAEDLLQVYRQSMESDPTLKAAAASRQASQEAKPQARALLLPSVGVTASQGNTFGVVGVSTGSDGGDTHSYAIGLTQPIYNRASQVQQRLAEEVVKQADADFSNAEDVLILRVSQGYFGVLAAIDNLTFATAEKTPSLASLNRPTDGSRSGWLPSLTFTMPRPDSMAPFPRRSMPSISWPTPANCCGS